MNLNPFLPLMFLLGFACTLQANDRPNIVILFTDDISARELPVYGSSVWSPPLRGDTSDEQYRASTPVLDRLAKDGCCIKTAWASVVCSPSRAMMMTGRYAHLHKWWGNKSKGTYVDESGKENVWPLYLSSPHQIGHVAGQAGYGTYWAGKTQMAGDLREYGFDQGCFTPGNLSDKDNPFTDFKLEYRKVDGKRQAYNVDTNLPVDTYLQHGWYWHPHVRLMNHDGKDFQWWPNTETSKKEFGLNTYGPDVELDFIFDFMEGQVAKKKPFLVYHTTHLGHDGFDWFDPNSKSSWPGTPVIKWDGQQYTRTAPNVTGDAGQYDTHGTVTPPGMHSHINYLDYQTWLYQEKFKQLGIADNTIFIFCSDNGSGGYGKNSTDRQKGTHVPMIIWAPGMTKHGMQDVLVNMSDILPTIAELTGAQLPDDYEINGESLVPFLFGDKTEHRQWLYGYKDKEQVIRGKKVLRDGRGKWWDVSSTPADLISFPQIKDWKSVTQEHRDERKKLLAVLPRFDQQTHGRNADGTSPPATSKKKKKKKTEQEKKQTNAATKWEVKWEDRFDEPEALAKRYYVPKDHAGAFTIQDGKLVGKQIKSNHGSVIRAEVDFSDVDIEFDFRFRGTTRFNFVIDDKNEKSVHAGHICRASVTPGQLLLSDDMSGAMNLEVRKQRKAKDLPAAQAAALEELLERTRKTVPIKAKPNQWHKLRLRIRGEVMKAFLDDQLVSSLRSPGFEHPTKNKCGFTVNGQSVDFDNLRIRTPTKAAAKPKTKRKAELDQSSKAERKPNILWVVTDDQRSDSIAAFNRILRNDPQSALGYVQSPNVDRLAKMGTTFINTFNQNPGCAPSRTLMHTGRYSHHTGVYGFEYYNGTNKSHWHPMAPEILRDQAGYQTVAVGKLGIRARHFQNKADPTASLYQTHLGYRKEFSAKGMVDWNSEKKWSGGKPGPKEETFYFPDGKTLQWPEDKNATPNDRAEILKRLDLLRQYSPGDQEPNGSILGGVNSQTGDSTRDGNFASAMLNHLAHADKPYTDKLGREQRGPDSDAPLFAYVGFEFPHTPVLPPAEFRKQFSHRTYAVPEFSDAERAAFTPQMSKLFGNSQSDHFTDDEKQQMIADYYAFCAYGDSLVGKTVDGFIEYSENQNRPWMVLYVCGDHGWRLNEHGMVSKFAHYDVDLHNPIIVVSSDQQTYPAGKVVDDFTEFVDIAPTFLAAAGLDVSSSDYDYLDGRQLAKTVTGELQPRDYIIAEPTWVTGPRAVIRTKDYKFAMKTRPRAGHGIQPANAGKDMQWAIEADLDQIEPALFDLRSDPREVNNLAHDPAYRPVLDALRKKLQNIVLGDGRIEVAWSKKGADTVHESRFALGAHDGIIEVPAVNPVH